MGVVTFGVRFSSDKLIPKIEHASSLNSSSVFGCMSHNAGIGLSILPQ